jgi:hypothetical protein
MPREVGRACSLGVRVPEGEDQEAGETLLRGEVAKHAALPVDCGVSGLG